MNLIKRFFRIIKAEIASDISRDNPKQSSSTNPPPKAEADPSSGSGQTARMNIAEQMDASGFRPISTDQAKAMIDAQGSSWRNAYFDSLVRIPNADFPTVQLIDQAMVGQGLITPGELARIHEVGRKMDRIRKEDSFVHARVEQEVAKSREDREAKKARKKAEAARKKEERARDVAKRRETEIFFLGRGVSRHLWDRRADIESLNRYGLPLIITPMELAEALNLSIGHLRQLAWHEEASGISHYYRFSIPKKSGGERFIFAPHQRMADAQFRILQSILEKIPTHEACHGFVKGRSTVTNALPHVGSDVLINIDLADFFPSITFPRVQGLLRKIGYSPAISTILALICTESPRTEVEYEEKLYHVATGPRSLPQGACTSPALSNLIARKMDARFDGLCHKMSWTYTRYADDMTFSTKDENTDKVGYMMARIRHIVENEGFTVNPDKTRVNRQNSAQKVTGIVVNRRPGVPRRLVRRIRAILHRAKSEGLARQNRENLPHFEAWLRGMIAYIRMVDPVKGQSLLEAWEKVRD